MLDWQKYIAIADRFQHKAKYQDKGKELTTYGLVRIAQYEVADYWRKWYKRNQNTSCERCSKAQRRKCKEGELTHNYCYRKWYCCLKNSVTKGGAT
jgi:hypothetical protein